MPRNTKKPLSAKEAVRLVDLIQYLAGTVFELGGADPLIAMEFPEYADVISHLVNISGKPERWFWGTEGGLSLHLGHVLPRVEHIRLHREKDRKQEDAEKIVQLPGTQID